MVDRIYTVTYVENGVYETPKQINVKAKNKMDAYEQALFELDLNGVHPYAAYVEYYLSNNMDSKPHVFNDTMFGKPY